MFLKNEPVDPRITVLMTSSQSKNPLININSFIVILMCMWVSWPYINYKLGFLPFLLLLMIWLLTSEFKWYFVGYSIDIIMIIFWVLTIIPYLLTGNFRYGPANEINTLISFTLFFGGMFINHYYMYCKKNLILLGKISFFTILFYFVASIQSYIGLLKYPLASRALATGDDPFQDIYAALGIGGFGFVYSAVFINILILYFLIKKKSLLYKFISIMIYLVITAMLISASYATSLLLVFTGTLLVVTIKGKRSLIFSIIFAFLFLLIIPFEWIGYLLVDVAVAFESNQVINSKFLDLAQMFLGDSVGSQTSGRGELYLASLETFFKYPIFGVYGPFGNEFTSGIGGHSGWLDLLASYGIFGALPLFLAIFFNFKKQLKFYTNHPYYHFLLTAQILFIVFGFINPIIYIYQIGFVMFVVAPALPFIYDVFSKRIRSGENG